MDLQPEWEYVADRVMGGVSAGHMSHETFKNREATVLRGHVSLDNNGGFVQMAFDLRPDGAAFDASVYTGVSLDLCGNRESYDLRLRTDQLTRPWQSFRTEFATSGCWQSLQIPFDAFVAHKTHATLDISRIRRIGLLAIGREFQAELAVAQVSLYT